MKGNDQRLNSFFRGMSVEQRLDHFLGNYRDGRRSDRSLLDGLSDLELERWTNMSTSFNAAHIHMQWVVAWLDSEVSQLQLRVQLTAAQQALLVGIPDTSKQFTSQEVLDRHRAELVVDVEQAWQSLVAIEKITDALNADCFGRDVLHPDSRTTLESCKLKVQRLAAVIGTIGWGKCILGDPHEGELALATLRTRTWFGSL